MEREQERNRQDQIIRCCDYGACLILTLGERQFYLDRKLNLPKRCPECRQKRRHGMGEAHG